MKYVIMFTSTPSTTPPSRPRSLKTCTRVSTVVQDNADSIEDSGAELQPVDAATTVRHGAKGAVVVDGPFTEAREAVGGFTLIDVADLDARDRPGADVAMLELEGTSVEIRPIVTDYSQFEQ